MAALERSYWLAVGSVIYVLFGALHANEETSAALTAAVVLPLALAEVWRRTAGVAPGDERVAGAARSALRVSTWGASLWLAARTGPTGHAAFDTAANVGAGSATVAGLVALARIAPLGGIAVPPSETYAAKGLQAPSPLTAAKSLDAAVLAATLWAMAVALPASRALLPLTDLRLDPLAIDYATTTAAVASLLLCIVSAWRLRVERRFELGVGDRASGALALSIAAFGVAIPSSAVGIAAPDRVVPIGALAAAIACAWTACLRDPTTVSVALRGIVAVLMLGTPTSLALAAWAQNAGDRVGEVTLLGCALSIAIGALARAVARPLGPERSRWLFALEKARQAALQPEPEAAIAKSLLALREATAVPGARAELWRLDPAECLSVDVAGYLHVEKAHAPEALTRVALQEPEHTLRLEALRAVQVRRSDLRPLTAWFETHDAFSATAIADDEGVLGFLTLPRGGRTAPMTLEEARSARGLADRLSALLSVSSAMARSRERELEATRETEALKERCAELVRTLAEGESQHRRFAEMLAAPLRAAAYSASTRLSVQALERLAKRGEPMQLLVPDGVDAIAWGAVAHLASPKSGGPFVVVPAARSRQELADWLIDGSPLERARGGTLFLLDAQSVSPDAQELIVRHLRRPGGPGLVCCQRAPQRAGEDERPLALLTHDRTVALPTLAQRTEDLRALALDGLAATGVRHDGEPLGLEPAALRLLLEYPWPGNDLELRAVLARAAALTEGLLVREATLRLLGLADSAEAGGLATVVSPAAIHPLPRRGTPRTRRPRRPTH